MGCLCFGAGHIGHALGFAPDIDDGQRPKWNQIDAGDELGKKRRQEFPVPAEQVNHQGSDAEIEDVVRRR